MPCLAFLRQKQICFDSTFYRFLLQFLEALLTSLSRGTPTASGAFLAPRATFPGALPQGRRWRAWRATVLDQEERKVWHDVVRRGALGIQSFKVLNVSWKDFQKFLDGKWLSRVGSYSRPHGRSHRKTQRKSKAPFGPEVECQVKANQDD